MMKASIKPRETYFDGKLAYALDETEDPDYKPVLILGPGNIQRSKEKNHEKWARVFNSVSYTLQSSLPTRITHSLDFFHLLSFSGGYHF